MMIVQSKIELKEYVPFEIDVIIFFINLNFPIQNIYGDPFPVKWNLGIFLL